tara:strand:- start:5217 stop:5741 length:525 start_codon:yes stop_codon:yes gene_type:complete
MAGLKAYHPTKGAMKRPTLSTPHRAATPWGGRRPQGSSKMPNRNCPPGRGGPRGGKDIIAVGTNQAPAILGGAGPWAFTFDIAEDCRLCKLNIQVTDPGGTLLDSSTQIVTALNHNNDRLISGLQVNGAIFDAQAQVGTNPVWARYAVVSDQVQIQGSSSFPNPHTISVTLSTM